MAPRFLPGNRLTLLNSGAEYFPALIAAINEARHDVHRESFICADDATGRAVVGAMTNAGNGEDVAYSAALSGSGGVGPGIFNILAALPSQVTPSPAIYTDNRTVYVNY